MALTRSHLVRPRDLKLVYLLDPSVSQAQSNAKKYIETGDIGHLRCDGDETVFHTRLLSGEQWRDLQIHSHSVGEGHGRGVALYEAAFASGVTQISNWILDDGSRGELPQDLWLECIPDACRAFIGMMIVNLSRVQRTKPQVAAPVEAAQDVPLSSPPTSCNPTGPLQE